MSSGRLAEELKQRGLQVYQEVFVRGVVADGSSAPKEGCTLARETRVTAEEVTIR